MTDQFRLDPDGNLRSALLEQVRGLAHGFGTKTAALPNGPLATIKQIHSAIVIEAEYSSGNQGEGDALIAARTGIFVGVKTADCVPILLVDPNHRVVAAVHAGWRGTAAEIVIRTVEKMAHHGTAPGDLLAAIGPAIGPCCYEVGADVKKRLTRWDTDPASNTLDLKAINREQLAAIGVQQHAVAIATHCTRCEADLFFSYRREAEQAGRMMSWIGWES